MPNMSVLLQISALFITMTVGYVSGRMKLLDSPTIKGISTLIIKVTLPCLILISLQKPFSGELMGTAFTTLLVATLYYACAITFALIVVKLLGTPKKQLGTLAFSLGFSNAAFIGFPVISSILGEGALFLTSIHNILFNVLAFSVGIVIVGSSGSVEGSVPIAGSGASSDGAGSIPAGSLPKRSIPWRTIININVIASIVGFILFVSSITIPRFLKIPLDMIGGLTTPLAMLVTGAMLSRTKLSSLASDWRLYAVAIARLALWPLLTALVLRLCRVTGDLFYITVIISGMPAASNTSLIAEVYGGDTDTASSIVFMTTLFSVTSIPLLALMLGR